MRQAVLVGTYLLLAVLLPPSQAEGLPGGQDGVGVMTNADIIRLLKRGAAQADIIRRIRQSAPRFDTSAPALKRLRRAGAGGELIREVLHPQRVVRVTDPTSHGPGPCATPPGGVKAAAGVPAGVELPPSRLHAFIRPDDASTHSLPPAPAASDPRRPGTTGPMMIGVVKPLSAPLTTSEHGRCFDLDGGRVEILRIVSGGARQLRARFASVAMPAGAKLFVYSGGDAREIYGPYEGRGPSADGTFWSPPVEGDAIVIEYYDPLPAAGRLAPFRVTEVSHVF